LDVLIHSISHRIVRYLERTGLLVRDMANSHLTRESQDGTVTDDLLGHSITYRIAWVPINARSSSGCVGTSPDRPLAPTA